MIAPIQPGVFPAFDFNEPVARQPARLTLPANQIHRMAIAGGKRITCRSGIAWITMENDPADYILRAGDSMKIAGTGLLVIQPLTAVDLMISSPAHDRS